MLSTAYKFWTTTFRPTKPVFTEDQFPDLSDTVALVTGASSGIGLEITKLLLRQNCHVIAAIRNPKKMAESIGPFELELKGKGKLDVVTMDLTDLATIKDVAPQVLAFTDRLDLIIHNAGVAAYGADKKTKQGLDYIVGANNIAPLLLQKYLDPLFLKEGGSQFKRLVWLASNMHLLAKGDGGVTFDKFSGKKPYEHDVAAYAQSKTASIYYAKVWSDLHAEDIKRNDKIVSLSVHPGFLRSNLGNERDMNFLARAFLKLAYDIKFAQYSVLYAALSPDIKSDEHQGAFVIPWGHLDDPRPDVKAALTNGFARKVWDFSTELAAGY